MLTFFTVVPYFVTLSPLDALPVFAGPAGQFFLTARAVAPHVLAPLTVFPYLVTNIALDGVTVLTRPTGQLSQITYVVALSIS